jgi:hypothetical protein
VAAFLNRGRNAGDRLKIEYDALLCSAASAAWRYRRILSGGGYQWPVGSGAGTRKRSRDSPDVKGGDLCLSRNRTRGMGELGGLSYDS